jgi:hypothetical protein
MERCIYKSFQKVRPLSITFHFLQKIIKIGKNHKKKDKNEK